MRNIFAALIIAILGVCTSYADSQTRWNDMWTDIYLRHQYEKYSCGYHKTHRCHRYSCTHRAPRHCSKAEVIPPNTGTQSGSRVAQETYNEIQALSGRISVLEEATKTNVAMTNENQQVLVNQINTLKKTLAELQNKPITPVATHLPGDIKIPED